MKKYSTLELLIENKPKQFLLFDELLRIFSENPHLSHAFAQGSIASANFDRSSDLDLVLAVDEQAFGRTIAVLDSLMTQHFNVLFPGWHDKIVANFGGEGFVYLLESAGEIFQVDLYVLPSGAVDSFVKRSKAKLVFLRESEDAVAAVKSLPESGGIRVSAASSVSSLIVEAMILSFLILKRIKRSQHFLNYSESHLLASAMRDIVRLSLDPDFAGYGWYHLEEHLKDSEVGKEALTFLAKLVEMPAFHDRASLALLMGRLLTICKVIAPKEIEPILPSVDFYLRRMGLQ